jgi:hypothetical protein
MDVNGIYPPVLSTVAGKSPKNGGKSSMNRGFSSKPHLITGGIGIYVP